MGALFALVRKKQRNASDAPARQGDQPMRRILAFTGYFFSTRLVKA